MLSIVALTVANAALVSAAGSVGDEAIIVVPEAIDAGVAQPMGNRETDAILGEIERVREAGNAD